jgi:hypothetical protein
MEVSRSQCSELTFICAEPSCNIFTSRKFHCGLSCIGSSATLFFMSLVTLSQSQASMQRCSATMDFHTKDLPLFPPTSNSPELYSLFVDVSRNHFFKRIDGWIRGSGSHWWAPRASPTLRLSTSTICYYDLWDPRTAAVPITQLHHQRGCPPLQCSCPGSIGCSIPTWAPAA